MNTFYKALGVGLVAACALGMARCDKKAEQAQASQQQNHVLYNTHKPLSDTVVVFTDDISKYNDTIWEVRDTFISMNNEKDTLFVENHSANKNAVFVTPGEIIEFCGEKFQKPIKTAMKVK